MASKRGPLFWSIDLESAFGLVPNYSQYCRTVGQLEIQHVEASPSTLLCRIALANWGVSRFQMNFKIALSASVQNATGI